MWPNPLFNAVLVTLTEEILSGKLHFLFVYYIIIDTPRLVLITLLQQYNS